MKTQGLSNNSATAHFYDTDTVAFLQYKNDKGGSTFQWCDSVSEMQNEAESKGLVIDNVMTHHDC